MKRNFINKHKQEVIMKKTYLLISAIITFLVFSNTLAGDIEIVKSILEQNNIELRIEEITTIKGGRVIELNLNNRDLVNEGIKFLPKEIGELTELQILTINDNDLTHLPEEIFNCTKLVKLEIKNNELINLPSGIRKLTNLRELDLRNNEIAKLTNEIGKLRSLVKLQLWGNELKTLPSKIGNLISLKELYLRGNKLTSLPLNIIKLKLTYLDILENHLCVEHSGLHIKIIKWLKKYNRNYEALQFCNNDYRFRFRNYLFF